MRPNKITVLAIEGCVSSVITGVMDTLNIANIFWETVPENKAPLFKTEIVTITGDPVKANIGLPLYPEKSIPEVTETDLILLPAFLPPFDVKCDSIKPAIDWIIKMYREGTKVAAPCTSSFLLAETGLLDGKIATTNWQFANKFRREYPDVNLNIEKIVTEDSGLVCSGAATAFSNLCLYFINEFGNSELASLCSKALLIDPDKQNQSPYMLHDFWKNHLDTQILSAQNWMEENFAEKISIDDIAGKAGISPRHFKRRFKKATNETPLTYLQHLRVEKAKKQLENSLDTVNEITWQVGYEDINSFRRLFKKNTGMTPKEFRNKFSKIR